MPMRTGSPRPAKEDESLRFGLPHTASMFLIYRTGFTADGTAIRATVTAYPADGNQFRYQYSNLAGLRPGAITK